LNEAGEYEVTLSGSDGEIGVAQRLVLEGDNPPVYRGAIEFEAAKPGKKRGPKIEAVGSDTDGGAADSDDQNGGTAAAPVSNPPSIAVLPFSNLSGDKENEYFSDGLAEDILNALVKVPGLLVTARTSTLAFVGKGQDIRSIAQG